MTRVGAYLAITSSSCNMLNSSVASRPANDMIAIFPPGWSSRNGVAFSTCPLMITQQSVSEVCLATSSSVYVLDMTNNKCCSDNPAFLLLVMSKTYTLEEVAKHTSETDCWVIINGQVLNATPFLDDHPGGKMAIMSFAGRDATEEFNMLHDEEVIAKYAPTLVIGTLAVGKSKL
eukprot:gb/GEZN01016618.1/.p2 GENE.gb/GEZN01016618.1/~~gb/GEZN01016618.1/.p2  ORF type:complete len:175 (-),score=23.58 gb/GEZN01016618.1/:228-752(-)